MSSLAQSQSHSSNPSASHTNLFVKNLPFNFTEENLRMLFSKFGNIRSLKIKRPDIRMNFAIVTTAYSIGYVDFEREEDAKNAI